MPQTPDRPIPIDKMPFDHHPASAPFVENAALPAMEAVAAIPLVVAKAAAGNLMGDSPEPDEGGIGRMEPIPTPSHGPRADADDLVRQIEGSVARGAAVHPDQQPTPAATQAGREAQSEGYVRLLVRAEGAKLSVVGAKDVDGPLVTSDRVGAGLVYEVTAGGRRIGLEWLPDGGAQRSFTNIDRPEATLGHHFAPLLSFEFTVRIPRYEVTADALPKVEVALHRLVNPPDTPLTAQPIAEQLGAAVTEVARLPGITLDDLEPAVHADLTRILRNLNTQGEPEAAGAS